MGASMRLGVHTWLQSLIILPLLFFSADSSASILSKVGFWFDPKDYNDSSSESGGFDLSKCKLDAVKGKEEEGNKNDIGPFVKTEVTPDYIATIYGKDKGGFLLSAQWTYGIKVNFNAPEKYRKPILNALKNALANGNCELANYFANMLANGKEFEDKDGKKNWGYSDDKEHGTTCVVGENASDGLCRRKYLSEDNPDGTKRVCVSPADSGDCSEDLSLDELSKKTNNKDKNQGDSGSSGGKGDGSSIDDKRGGSNGSSSGAGAGSSGSGNGNSDKGGKGDGSSIDDKTGGSNGSSSGTGTGSSGSGNGNSDKGDKGDGSGEGSGKGQGGGVGDKEGDGDKDKTEDVEIKDAPTMKETFAGLRDKIKDKLLKDFEISGAQCPTAQLSLFNRTFTIDQHCDILESIRDFMQSLMMFLYTFAAIRIVLSA